MAGRYPPARQNDRYQRTRGQTDQQQTRHVLQRQPSDRQPKEMPAALREAGLEGSIWRDNLKHKGRVRVEQVLKERGRHEAVVYARRLASETPPPRQPRPMPHQTMPAPLFPPTFSPHLQCTRHSTEPQSRERSHNLNAQRPVEQPGTLLVARTARRGRNARTLNVRRRERL